MEPHRARRRPSIGGFSRGVFLNAGDATLEGWLAVPPAARGVVAFAHGTGSARHALRNRFLAEVLRRSELGTLLFDLLTPDEELIDGITGHLSLDVRRLAERLVRATCWLEALPVCERLPIGYFGAGVGGAAAIRALVQVGGRVQALVIRSGRLELAGEALEHVHCPVRLIVGARDTELLERTCALLPRLGGHAELRVVSAASSTFEEPGSLEVVARLAAEFFRAHLGVWQGAGR